MFKKQLDKIDLGILDLLQRDCRITHKAIASELNISITPVHVRIKRLEEEGFISRYVALLDPKKIGEHLTPYVQVHIKPHSEESLAAFGKEMAFIPEVVECSQLTGKADFLLKVMVRDMEGFNQLVMDRLSKLYMVENMESFFVMSQPKYQTAVAIDAKLAVQ
mgnify:CR=1 FL=1